MDDVFNYLPNSTCKNSCKEHFENTFSRLIIMYSAVLITSSDQKKFKTSRNWFIFTKLSNVD